MTRRIKVIKHEITSLFLNLLLYTSALCAPPMYMHIWSALFSCFHLKNKTKTKCKSSLVHTLRPRESCETRVSTAPLLHQGAQSIPSTSANLQEQMSLLHTIWSGTLFFNVPNCYSFSKRLRCLHSLKSLQQPTLQ